MAWMFAPDGETRLHPFGEGGGQLISEQMQCPLLGQLPLDPVLQEATNASQPVVAHAPESPAAEAFFEFSGNDFKAPKNKAPKNKAQKRPAIIMAGLKPDASG